MRAGGAVLKHSAGARQTALKAGSKGVAMTVRGMARTQVRIAFGVEGVGFSVVFEAHRLVYHSTLGLGVIKKKRDTATTRGAACCSVAREIEREQVTSP